VAAAASRLARRAAGAAAVVAAPMVAEAVGAVAAADRYHGAVQYPLA